jgi:seryl-tRNA(Sec) selenium transferase
VAAKRIPHPLVSLVLVKLIGDIAAMQVADVVNKGKEEEAPQGRDDGAGWLVKGSAAERMIQPETRAGEYR